MSKQDNRVLSRLGARELSVEEVAVVNGGSCRKCTLTACSIDASGKVCDGDPGECGGGA